VQIITLEEILSRLNYAQVIDRMRDALIANSRGECDTPMPMHLEIASERAEIHMKASYRRGGRYFALKAASTFPRNADRGLPTGNGMMMLFSAETGDPIALLEDGGHLTDVRTAAVSAMMARELGRRDTALGILGTGIQARLQAKMHAEVLPLDAIWIWGRNPERTADCGQEIATPDIAVHMAMTPAEVARETRLIVTATASRSPLLDAADIQPGTHISAVGSDAPGKQELDPEILRRAAVIIADSHRQCAKLGELQYAPDVWPRPIEFSGQPLDAPKDAITVCDFTGLGAEDLYIAEYIYHRSLQ
jgi:ornithine cyclodeaminase